MTTASSTHNPVPGSTKGRHVDRVSGIGGFLMLTVFLISATASAAQESYDSLLQQALQFRNQGDFTAAEQSLRSARELALHTNEVDALLGLIVAYQERYSEALAILNSSLLKYSNDIQLQLAKARVLSFKEDYVASLALTRSIIASQPDNMEATLLAARVNFFIADYIQSGILFRRILSWQPDNQDALLGLYDVESASGNTASAAALLDQAESIDPAAPGVLLRRERNRISLDSAIESHELNAGFSISNIDGAELSNWYDRSIEYRFQSQTGNQFFIRSEHLHRFGAHDTLTEIGTLFTLGADSPVEIAVAYGDDSDFSPEQRFRLATSLRIFEDTEGFGTVMLDAAYSQAEYQTGNVKTGRFGVTHYFNGFNGWANAAALWVRDENNLNSLGWVSGINWQASNRVRLGYAYTDAPETENNITTATRNHHFYARYQLTGSSAIRLDGSRNQRKNSYSRDSLALSLQFRF